MRIEFNRSGAERKALVTEISEILNEKPKYLGMPTAAYAFEGFTIDRNGTAEFEDCIFPKGIKDFLLKLEKRGFKAENSGLEEIAKESVTTPQSEELELTVAIPIDKVKVGNLTNLLEAKGTLIKKALGIEDIRIEIDKDKVLFPWFKEVSPEEAMTYTKFITALCKMGLEQKRINATEKAVENEKYTFRCFLLRLGFIGNEYKTDRRILLKNLSGNSAFRNGGDK